MASKARQLLQCLARFPGVEGWKCLSVRALSFGVLPFGDGQTRFYLPQTLSNHPGIGEGWILMDLQASFDAGFPDWILHGENAFFLIYVDSKMRHILLDSHWLLRYNRGLFYLMYVVSATFHPKWPQSTCLMWNSTKYARTCSSSIYGPANTVEDPALLQLSSGQMQLISDYNFWKTLKKVISLLFRLDENLICWINFEVIVEI